MVSVSSSMILHVEIVVTVVNRSGLPVSALPRRRIRLVRGWQTMASFPSLEVTVALTLPLWT